MKTYHICKKSVWEQHYHKFCPQKGSHYIDLDHGFILIACNFADELYEADWAAVEGVEHLPHPLYEGNKPLKPHHHAKVKHLGVEAHHTILDLARTVGQISPLMRLSSFATI